jgi:hypothetical protein
VAGALLLGSFLVYKAVNTSGSGTDAASNTPAPEVKPEPAAVSTNPPAAAHTNTVVSAPPVTSNAPAVTTTVPPASTSPEKAIPTAAEADKAMAEKTKRDMKRRESEADYNKTQKVTIMGNEPIFGDMIDSSKGVIHSTKEKESTKQAAKTKGTGGIGLNSLFNLNLDSIKKYNESFKKDSIH